MLLAYAAAALRSAAETATTTAAAAGVGLQEQLSAPQLQGQQSSGIEIDLSLAITHLDLDTGVEVTPPPSEPTAAAIDQQGSSIDHRSSTTRIPGPSAPGVVVAYAYDGSDTALAGRSTSFYLSGRQGYWWFTASGCDSPGC